MGSHEVQLRNEKTTLKIVFFKHIFHVGVKFVSRIKEHLPQVMQKTASTVKFNYEKFTAYFLSCFPQSTSHFSIFIFRIFVVDVSV